jgi:hypothetical protein
LPLLSPEQFSISHKKYQRISEGTEHENGRLQFLAHIGVNLLGENFPVAKIKIKRLLMARKDGG